MKKIFAIGIAIIGISTVEACGAHQKLEDNVCQCVKGYVRHKGECKACPANSKYNCRLEMCRCSKGLVYDHQSHSCKNTCGANQRYDGYQCVCKTGYLRIDGKCDVCPSKSYYDADKETCFCNKGLTKVGGKCQKEKQDVGSGCGKNEVFKQGGCQCKDAYMRYDGVNCTKKCPSNGYWEGECKCNWGYTMEDGQCVKQGKCKSGEMQDGWGNCVCKNNYVRYDGITCLKTCPNYWDGKKCV